jgi:adenylosuccinate synthase
MAKAIAVIGANWGDCGKGLMTDYFASIHGGTVIRFSGGAQAGHTTQTPEGIRHVFHHFGSGTLLDCPTHFSHHFIVNPLLFVREYQELQLLGITPKYSCDSMAWVTTPFDMAINQELEHQRGQDRHGSVGMGIYETVLRCQQDGCGLYAYELANLPRWQIKGHIYNILKKHSLPRAQKLGIDLANHPATSDGVIERFLDDCEHFVSCSNPFNRSDTYIFEGSQGLMLDHDYGEMPHCSPGSFGLRNIPYLASRLEIQELTAVYITRTYATRHGAGTLPGECDLGLAGTDLTNKPHDFQGGLRYAPLDTAALKSRTQADFNKYAKPHWKMGYAVTCCDQFESNVVKDLNPDFCSDGPTRKDVRQNRTYDLSNAHLL